jgi:hypothetical protein
MYSIASILLALLAYVLAKAIYDSKLFLRLSVFFLFFGGNIGALFMLFVTHHFDFSIGWLFEDATKLMDAPGSGFAVIISLAAIYLLFKTKKEFLGKQLALSVYYLEA